VRPEPAAPATPKGETLYKYRKLSRGASTGSGWATGVSVMGSNASENMTETSAKGTKPMRSPTKISH
jgi:hypothetical protein